MNLSLHIKKIELVRINGSNDHIYIDISIFDGERHHELSGEIPVPFDGGIRKVVEAWMIARKLDVDNYLKTRQPVVRLEKIERERIDPFELGIDKEKILEAKEKNK